MKIAISRSRLRLFTSQRTLWGGGVAGLAGSLGIGWLGAVFLGAGLLGVAIAAPALATEEGWPDCTSPDATCDVRAFRELPHEVTETDLVVVPTGDVVETALEYADGRALALTWTKGQSGCEASAACPRGARIECSRPGTSACGEGSDYVHCGSFIVGRVMQGRVITCKGRSEDVPEDPVPDPDPPPSGDEEEPPEPPPEPPGEDEEEPPGEEGGEGDAGPVYHCDMDIQEPTLGRLIFCIEYDAERIGQTPTPEQVHRSQGICSEAGGAWGQGPCSGPWTKRCQRPSGVVHYYHLFTEGAPEAQCENWGGTLTEP